MLEDSIRPIILSKTAYDLEFRVTHHYLDTHLQKGQTDGKLHYDAHDKYNKFSKIIAAVFTCMGVPLGS